MEAKDLERSKGEHEINSGTEAVPPYDHANHDTTSSLHARPTATKALKSEMVKLLTPEPNITDLIDLLDIEPVAFSAILTQNLRRSDLIALSDLPNDSARSKLWQDSTKHCPRKVSADNCWILASPVCDKELWKAMLCDGSSEFATSKL